VSALPQHRYLCPAVCRCESSAAGSRPGPERLRWLVRRIADDDRAAFAELVDEYSDQVSAGLRRQVPDPRQAASVFAGTFVEVWWLAGGHVDPDTDVMAWIDRIVRRRIAHSRPPAWPAAVSAPPDRRSLGALWAQAVEVELAGLLR
jgi:hypothetical protein